MANMRSSMIIPTYSVMISDHYNQWEEVFTSLDAAIEHAEYMDWQGCTVSGILGPTGWIPWR